MQSAYGRDNGGDETSPSAADGEETNDKLNGGQDESNDESPSDPARNLLVSIETLLEILAEHLLGAGVLELPDMEGVEPEVELAGGAVSDDLFAVLLVTLAVRPETDLVEVLELLGGCGALQSLEEVVVDVDVLGEIIEDVVGVSSEAACICLWGLSEWRGR